jgi:chromosome segregation protein
MRRELPSQIEETEQRCRTLEEQQRSTVQAIAALESQLRDLDQRIKVATEEASKVEQETVATTRTQAAVVEEMLRSHQATQKREGALLERIMTQIAARGQRIEELDTEHTDVLARVERLNEEIGSLQKTIDQTRRRIQPSEDELSRLGEEQTALEERERIARDRVRDAESRHGRAQLEVDRCQDELALLAHRIEEDLGLVELNLADSVTAQTPLPLHPVVSELPIVEELPQGMDEEIQRLKARLRRVGGVNPAAPEDYAEVKERHGFLTEQSADLEAASEQLHQVVGELDELMEVAFQKTFDAVAERFEETFTTLFNGGAARLELTDPEDLMNTGVDIVARPPGKRAQRLALLSGGERSLTAVALMFAILQVSPAPFCVLDEVDAMLDEANVGRFRGLLQSLSEQTQFIIITHNRNTVEAADTIYGISMGTDGVSQVVSLQLE